MFLWCTHTNTHAIKFFLKLHCSYLLHSLTCYRCCHMSNFHSDCCLSHLANKHIAVCVSLCVCDTRGNAGCISSKKDMRMQGWHSVLKKGSKRGVGRLWDQQQGFCFFFFIAYCIFFYCIFVFLLQTYSCPAYAKFELYRFCLVQHQTKYEQLFKGNKKVLGTKKYLMF